MRDEDKTKEQLLNELIILRQRNIELEAAQHYNGRQSPYPSTPIEFSHEPIGRTLNYRISDLIDIPLLQQMFASFFNLTGIMHAVLDADNNILSSIGWQDICTKFHRICPQTECRCRQSDSYIASHLHEGPYIGYKCLNGLMDYATPIIVEGKHLATIFIGQLLHEPPDEEYFRTQAHEFGFDETAYIEALRKVNIFPENQVKSIIEFYSKLGQVLASTGLKRLRQIEMAENKFSKAFQCNPEPITLTTLKEGYYVEVNDAWVKTTGFERHEGIGRTGMDLGIWINSEERKAMLNHLREHGCVRDFEARFRTKSGGSGIFLVSADIIDIDGTEHLICVHKEVTESKKAEEALRLSEERFSKAFDASPNCISISSLEEGQYLAVNESFCRTVGYSKHEIAGRTAMESGFWFDPADRLKVKEKILRKEPVRDLEINFRRKFGEPRRGLFSAEGIVIDGQACLLSIITDVTERRRDEEKIRYLSFHDKLTGLYNRAYFEEELKRIDKERQLPISIIMGDVNGLKLVNDAMGHLEGDALLKAVTDILKKSCREEDIIARWGGDEFIILLPDCPHQSAVKILQRIKDNCKLGYTFPIETSISLGLATKQNIHQDIEYTIKEAEDKMYRHKLLEDKSTRSSFITSLQKALLTRHNETEEHCQRMQEMALKIGRLVGLPESELDNLKLLATLHDIGKIAIPNSILGKQEKLTNEEWETVKKHAEIGYRIALSSPDMAPIAEAILHHHERWDGKGYPLGLKGETIPFISRIIAIADTCDVMFNGRPYQKAVGLEEIKAEVLRCSGSQFDPDLTQIAVAVLDEALIHV
ncbi:MAG: PocR ligand-binding domain-containing protein [Syntrophomonadaceae bacterium]